MHIKLFLLILFSSFYKIACAQHNGNINFTIGSTYNYRDFNESRYKFSKRRINEFNKYDEVLDSIDVPVIAPSLALYYEAKIDTFNNNGFMFRTGLQFGIKSYSIKARKVYYYSNYKYATGPVDSAIVGTYQHPMWGIPITSGYKFATKNNKLQLGLSAGPVINFWIGYSRFKTYKSQQQSIFNYYKPTRDLGYDDFKIADKESHLFLDANLRWQAQLAFDYKISKKWMLGLFCFWEDTIFQRKNGYREFSRKGSQKKYDVEYRRRFYSGNVSISISRSLK
jgi:hypothetical protein